MVDMIKKIKVLVVDDSILMRRMISDMINEDDNLQVVDTAKNGLELMEKLKHIQPDVITLDVEMPRMNGIEVLSALKQRQLNIPVIMLSSLSKSGAEITIRSLELGAFDFIAKPSGTISLDINSLKEELVSKLKLAAENTKSLYRNYDYKKEKAPITKIARERAYRAVVIGASSGGPKAIHSVITALPGDLGVPIFIVQHMPKGFTKVFADRLNSNSALSVREAEDMDEIAANKVFIAPGGFHLEVGSEKILRTTTKPPKWGVRPAVDYLFESASEVYKEDIISVVLTGMGKDGAKGTEVIKAGGGYTISEDQSTCTIYGMPKAAYETGAVCEVVPLYHIAERIVELLKYKGR